ncbi:MAG: hypothetical protein EKK64_05510 [Neisseriaceae bacterium]|nr:MAG: hypothetical protein EKK64_05510 [Neisseriaceae bacterium]
MELIKFKNWLIESHFSEMATLNFGGAKGHAGKDHTDTPTHYLQWMKDKIKSGEGNFNVTDNGRKLNSQEILNLIDKELASRVGSRPSTPAYSQTPKTAPTAGVQPISQGMWVWGKSIASRPDLGIPIAGLDLAMKQQDQANWMFVIIDAEEGRLVSRGLIPTSQIKEIVRSQKNENGQLVRGNKPSEILQLITPKKEKSKEGTIPEDRITPEQKAIEEKFEKMINSPNQSHMVISALAGSGKTSVLKHLAWKFSKGKKWLYLVFNSKNKEEAKEEFPANVQVETTNGWAGREVLGKNVEKPTDRIQGFSFSEKSRLLADSPSFKQVLKSLGLPDQDQLLGSDPKRLSGSEKTIWYTLRSINNSFKSEVLRLLGLCKSFAVDPRKPDFVQSIENVMQKYDFDTDMEDIKEKINKNSPWVMRELANYMKKDFATRNFKNEMINATNWMLNQVMPHGTEETFMADSGPQKGTEQKLGNKRDFDDDLWFSAIHADELKWPKYDVVLADEVQDFNVAQQIILKKLAENGAKIVAVGDKHQCHPAETIISLTGGGEKSIKDIQIGDQVVTYNSKKSYFPGTSTQGRKVLEKAERLYKGEIISIIANKCKMKCTPNHKCLVKFDNKDRNKYAVYLMVKGTNARIGMCRLNYRNGFGLAIRSHHEEADYTHILNIFHTEREARIEEITTSYKFNIPQLMFKNNGLYAAEQSFINEVYEKIGNNLENAKKCVESFGRDWEYPIWSKEKKEKFGKLSQNYIGSRKSFITQACNLISDFMLVRTFDGTNKGGKWEKIKIEKEYSEIPVYSLKVEPTEDGKRLYIADGIVVSNSIYRFRGADSDAFNQLKNNLQNISHDKDVEHQITSNFRSRQSIIDLANDEGKTSDHVSNLIKGRPFKETPGKIGKGVATKYEIKYDDAFQTLSDEMKDMGEVKQTAFLARTNEPLIHASLKLMKQGTPFIILGKDIANDLIKHIDKMTGLFKLGGEASVDELEYSISQYQEEMNDKHSGKSAMAGALKELKEISEAMISSLGQFKEESPDGSVFEFKKWLKSKFGGVDLEDSRSRSEFKKKVENQNPVILTTVHKSKGLQFQRVFILRDDLWPHPRSTREEDLEQEKNNRYIAMTRGEDEIHILDLEDQPGYKSKNKE